jgi:hypothetical protein
MFCEKCGSPIGDKAQFCSNCGYKVNLRGDSMQSSVTSGDFSQIPNNENMKSQSHENDQIYQGTISLSDKWAWALACVPVMSSLLYFFLQSITEIESGFSFVIAIAMNIIFVILDDRELKRASMNPDKWIWAGFFLVPVYLFLRANKTQKNYGYAITWCVLFFIDIIFLNT